ncbi:MAG: dicarboxylate/amino acid:cation symporter [Clostridia bacterium]|nr:dicarboxylate/amino acid:cation symporter [Clostridia bacterium]
MKKNWYTSHITLWIFIGLAAGIGFGFLGMFQEGFFGAVKPALDLVYTLYINALRMMIFPLVFASIVMGIQGIGSVGKTGKVGGQTLLYYCGTTLFASLLGLFLPKLLGIGKGVAFTLDATNPYGAVEFKSLLDTVKNLIPANPIASFANGDMLQILVFAVIIGVVCLMIKEKAEPFVKVVDAINEISMKIISFIMYFTPIGVFSSIAIVIQSNGIDTVISLGATLLILYITYIFYAVFVYGGLVRFVGKVSIREFFKKVMPAALNAFGTCSSSATIPLSKKAADDLGVPNEVSSLAIPLGATINMDAVSILMSFMIVFFGNATGTPISFGMLAIVLLANALLSIGCPGVPGGAIACFAALSAIAGLPAEIMAVYISVNTLCDMGATCVNVLGDVACSVAMKETCKLDKK